MFVSWLVQFSLENKLMICCISLLINKTKKKQRLLYDYGTQIFNKKFNHSINQLLFIMIKKIKIKIK